MARHNISAVSKPTRHDTASRTTHSVRAHSHDPSLRDELFRDDVLRFVERTTAASSVPLLVEDASTIEQIARVLL